MNRTSSLFALTLFGCAVDTSTATQEITNPDSNTVPASVVTVAITSFAQHSAHNTELMTARCSGVVIDPHWVLTSAHCWGDMLVNQPEREIIVADQHVEPSAVHFHPQAWADGEEVWTTLRPLSDDVVASHDLALVYIDAPLPKVAVLYHPPQPDQVSLDGHLLKLTGFASGPRTGHTFATANAPFPGGPMIQVTRMPSALEHGDSGGPGFVTVADGLPPSFPFLTTCAPAPGGANAEVVVGINQAVGLNEALDYLTPVYLPANLDWIAGFLGDVDRDGVCDAVDNCTFVPNNQDNCNIIAETHASWMSNHVVLGDACDPTPCPQPALAMTSFVHTSTTIQSTGDMIIVSNNGKAIFDELDIQPILGIDSVTSGTQSLFCLCRDVDGSAIDDPEVCAASPFFCTFDPLQLERPAFAETGGAGAPGPKQTYWHQITTTSNGGPATKAAWIPVAYPGDSAAVATWDYITDSDAWIANGWIPPLVTDPVFGKTRDLVGALWADVPTNRGATIHGYGEDCGSFLQGELPVCHVGDGFVHGVGPERRYSFVNVHRIPQYRPAPWWTYCAGCGDRFKLSGEDVSNPPFVTIDPASRSVIAWSGGHGFAADQAVSRSLLDALIDDTKVWVGASEPIAITNRPGSARAMMLSSDGTTVLGELTLDRAGFGMRTLAFRADMARRSGFATAYSRTADALFVAGGQNADGAALADVWTYRAGKWTSVAIARDHTVTNVLASVFSHQDLRMWIVTEPTRDERHLVRLDPSTGTVDSDVRLAQLDGLVTPYLTSLEDGRVVLSGNDAEGVFVGMLARDKRDERGGIVVGGQLRMPGALAMAPAVAHGQIALPLEETSRDGATIVTTTISAKAFE